MDKVRCRLIISWGRSPSQGFGCSPIKMVRELGSERKLLRHFVAIQRSKLTKIGETRLEYIERSRGNTEGKHQCNADLIP